MSGEFEFRPAVRENVGLLIALASPSGAGKTYSAMELASGICGNEPFAVIDTEARRALHYADKFKFEHLDFGPPFTPERYQNAIMSAEKRGFKAIVTDSFSHEHDGEGGVLDMQEAELAGYVTRAHERRDTRPDWQIRDSYNQLSWQKPKKQHKRMVQKFLQCRAHLIFCLRAEDKIEFKKGADGKTEVVEKQLLSGFKGWIPICDKRFLFELTASFILLPDRPGVPMPIKLQSQHRPFFDIDKPITAECGRKLAEWAKGGTAERTDAAMSKYEDKDEPLTQEEVKALRIGMEKAPNLVALERLGEMAKRAPAEDRQLLKDLYVVMLKKFKGIK